VDPVCEWEKLCQRRDLRRMYKEVEDRRLGEWWADRNYKKRK